MKTLRVYLMSATILFLSSLLLSRALEGKEKEKVSNTNKSKTIPKEDLPKTLPKTPKSQLTRYEKDPLLRKYLKNADNETKLFLINMIYTMGWGRDFEASNKSFETFQESFPQFQSLFLETSILRRGVQLNAYFESESKIYGESKKFYSFGDLLILYSRYPALQTKAKGIVPQSTIPLSPIFQAEHPAFEIQNTGKFDSTILEENTIALKNSLHTDSLKHSSATVYCKDSNTSIDALPPSEGSKIVGSWANTKEGSLVFATKEDPMHLLTRCAEVLHEKKSSSQKIEPDQILPVIGIRSEDDSVEEYTIIYYSSFMDQNGYNYRLNSFLRNRT